jgi:hypothetical protein
MGRKSALQAILDHGEAACEALDSRLSDEQKCSAGTWEVWAPKDAVCHVAEWLSRDVSRLSGSDHPAPFVGTDNLDDLNRTIFVLHKDKTWDEAMEFLRSVTDACRVYLDGLSDEQCEELVDRGDGTSRAVWRTIAGHAGWHLSMHVAAVYRRAGMTAFGTELERLTARLLGSLDDSDEWQASTQYNLACNHALCGDIPTAVRLLREAFRLNPELKEWAKKDPDLDGVRGDPEHSSLYEM